jgi:hypothetical protein
MKINEVAQPVAEAINFARYTDDADAAMKSGIVSSVRTLPKVRITDSMAAEIEAGSTNSLKTQANLSKLMAKYCSANLKKLAVQTMSVPVTAVVFEPLGNNKGECADLEIRLNSRYLKGIEHKILADWVNSLRKSGVDPLNYAETTNEIIDAFINNVLFAGSAETIALSCANTFIHEMVHAQQNQLQYNQGRTDTEYRSYLAPKDRFNKMMSDPGSVDMDDDVAHKIYRASPQEMAAFANQDAAKFIKDMGLNQPNAVADQKVMSELQHYVNEYFNDRTNPKEYRLLKRYGSLVYRAVMDYLQRNKK